MKNDVKSPTRRNQSTSALNGRFSRRLLPALIASCFACGPVYANPTGAQVVSGQAAISSNGNVLTITNSPGSIINWLSFSIGAGQVTQFLQQNSSSSVLNRIIGQNPTQIFGALVSNGKVFLINPNGILFEPGSQTNVGGLVASSLDISDNNFINGKHNFTSTTATPGSVVNQGNITTPNGGNIYLIAPEVQNSGILTSPQGEILLAAGHTIHIVDGADPNIQVVVSSPADQATNLGKIIAQGGKIGVLGALVNQSGEISADSAVVGQNGQVVLKSSQTTMVSGNSQTSAVGTASDTTGGTIELLGPQVGIVDNALINASGQNGGGKIMVGGDFHGANPAIQNANAIFIGSGAEIKADAVQAGSGGQVAVWSYDATRFYGNISAQGGAQGGNGGFVETSGKNFLDFEGLVNTGSAKGMAGTLLLDPTSIDITTGLTSGTVCTGCGLSTNATFANITAGTTSILNNVDLETQLGLSNVNVATISGGGGTIAVNAPVSWATNKTLSLSASGGIAINAAVKSTNGNLSMYTSGGNITENNGGYIAVNQLSAVASTGSVLLNDHQNYAVTIAGSAKYSFQFLSNSAIVVGAANGYTGISTSTLGNGTITLASYSGGSITTAGAASISGPTLSLTSLNGIGSQAAPLNTSVGSLSAAKIGSGSGDIVISNTGQPLTITGISDHYVNSGIYVISDNAITVSGTGIVNNSVSGASNIGIKASSGIAINAPISVTPDNTVALSTTNGNIVESGLGVITASNLSANASSGYITLNSANQIGTVSAFALTNFSLSNSSATNIGSVSSVGTGAAAIPAPAAGISVASTSGYIAVQSTGAITINSPLSITGIGTVALSAVNGDITQSAPITAGSLSAYASNGAVALTQSTNNVGGTVAGGSNNGSFTFTDSSSFNVGNISTTFGAVAPRNGITANGQAITLYSYGAIGSSGGTITGSSLSLSAQSGIGSQAAPLQTAVGSITATNGSGGGDIVIANSNNALTINSITQFNSGNIFVNSIGNPLTVTGAINTPNGDVGLAAGGNLAINGPINASGTVALMTTSGNITQTESISSTNLSAVASNGSVSLAYDYASTFSGSATNGFSIQSSQINVGSVPLVGASYAGGQFLPAISGITNTSGVINLTGITINTTGAATITGPSLTLNAAGGIGSKATPLNVNVGSLNATNGNGSGGGDIVIYNNGQPMTITGITEQSSYPYGTPGDIYVISNNAVAVTGAIVNNSAGNAVGISANGGLSLGANVTATSGPVVLSASNGNITQTAGYITANTLLATNPSGSIALNSVSNNVPIVAGNGSAGFSFANSGSITVGTAGNAVTLGNGSYFASVTGISSGAGSIGLSALGGIAVNAPLTAPSTGAIALQAQAGQITQSAIISGGSLSANATGSVNLALNNNIDPAVLPGIVAGTSGSGGFTFNNSQSFDIGTVSAVGNAIAQTGITANGQTISLTSGNGSIGTSAGTVTGTSAIVNSRSGIGAVNAPLVTSVTSLSAVNGQPGSGSGDVVISNSGVPLTVTSITQNNGGNIYVTSVGQSLQTGTLTTGNGNVGLLAGGILTVGPVSAGGSSGTIGLQSSGGTITQTGALTAANLTAIANTGSVTLSNSENNITGIVAGSSREGGFTFVDSPGFTVGTLASVGVVAPQSGISASGQTIALTSTTGSIGTASATITGTTADLNAYAGVGTSGTPLATSVGNLTVVNGSGGGDVAISNTGTPLVISGITQNNGGNIYVNANTQTMTVTGAVSTSNGNIGLTAGGDLIVGGAISASGANNTIALQSTGGNITQSAALQASNLEAVASAGSVQLTNSGNAITTLAGSSATGGFAFMNSSGINIGYVAGVGTISAQSGLMAPAQTVALTSSGGSINTVSASITAGTATLSAQTGIGTTSPLSTTVANLAVQNNGGVVDISNSASLLTINGITQTNGGNIMVSNNEGAMSINGAISTNVSNIGLTASGNLALNANLTTAGNVTLSSTNGAISSSEGTVTASSASLSAFAGVGTQSAPLAMSVASLSVSNGGTSTGGGDIAISNSGKALTITGMSQVHGGNIYVSTNTEPLTVSGAITTTNGDIGLMAGGNLEVNASVSAAGANGTVALQSTGGNITQAAPISATSLSAASSTGSVVLNDAGNNVGTVAGSAAGSAGFEYDGTSGFTVGSVPLAGPNYAGGFFIPAVAGITTNGPVKLDPAGDIFINAPINAGAGPVTITASGGSIVQEGSGSITTTGELILDALQNVGAGGTGNALQTNVGALSVTDGGNVYISNSGTGNLNVNQILGTGVVNLYTTGALTVPVGTGATTFTGSAITLASSGNMSLGANNIYSAANGTGPITLYAGFDEISGAAPLPNGSSSFLSQGGTFNGSAINLWTNSYSDFSGSATFSSPAIYHPGPAVIDVTVTGETVVTKTYDGTTTATLTGGTLVGLPSFDLPLVTFTESGYFVTANAGTNIAVVATNVLTLPNSLASQFVLVQPTNLTGTINPAVVTVAGQTAATKVYDGTTTATLQGGSLAGVLTADLPSVQLTQSGYFASVGPGKNIQIIATDKISGASASNYTLTQPTYIVADIISASSLAQTPNVFAANQNYIVGLNLTSGSILNGDGLGGNSSTSSGSGYSGSSGTSNSGTTDNENTSKKLYCN